MEKDIQLLISKAHAEFRKLRNGEVGDNLRTQGIDYKTIWGLESYRLKEIAEYMRGEMPNAEVQREVAEALWGEEVRESKMLATRLYPIGDMTEELADAWAKSIPYTELADQACMNLFARLPFAEALAARWMEGPDLQQYMALQIALRKDLSGYEGKAKCIAENKNKPMWLRVSAQRVCAETIDN